MRMLQYLTRLLLWRKKALPAMLIINFFLLATCGCEEIFEANVAEVEGLDAFKTSDRKFVFLWGASAMYFPADKVEYYRNGRELLESKIKGQQVKIVVRKKTKMTDGTPLLRADVYLQDGTFLNELMISEGYCNVERRDLKDDPETLKRFSKLQEEAKAAKKGGWEYYAAEKNP